MKNAVLTCALAALFGSASLFAKSADMVKVNLDDTLKSDVKVEIAPGQNGPEGVFGDKKRSEGPKIFSRWQYVAVPVEVIGAFRGDTKGTPDFVDDLDLTIYLLFRGSDKGSILLLKKEIHYVDIPIGETKKPGKPAASTMYGGVFISPRDARRIVESLAAMDAESKGKKGDLSKIKPEEGALADYLAGYAISATRNGINVMDTSDKTKKDPCFIIKNDLNSALKGKAWWLDKKRSAAAEASGIQLKAISETPYALHYSPLFPACSPMIAAVSAASSSSSASTGSGSSTSSPSALDSAESSTDSSTDTTDSSDSSTDTGDSGSGKKTKKTKKSKKTHSSLE